MKKLLLVAAALASHSAFSQGVTSDKILLGQSVALTGPAVVVWRTTCCTFPTTKSA